MNKSELYICLERKGNNGEPLYFIYSVTHSQLTCTDVVLDSKKSYKQPAFKIVVVINGGNQSMGCGHFGSKIVFAGGLVKGKETTGRKDKAVIVYDVDSKEVSYTDIPPMRQGKFEPLVFQRNNKLYVLDTSNDIRHQRHSFEIYFPKQRYWHRLANPYSHLSPVYIDGLSMGRNRYSWFVFGKCLFISLPHAKFTHLHHSMHHTKYFEAVIREPIPFYGMATTYYQHGFDDLALISFAKGRVDGRRLCFPANGFAAPELILEDESSSQPDCDLSHYFVDFGNGNFCLVTADNVSIHVCMFKISRSKKESDGSLNLRVSEKHIHKYDLAYFSKAGTSVRFVNSFALLSYEEEDDDHELNEESRKEIEQYSDSDEPDSDLDEESTEGFGRVRCYGTGVSQSVVFDNEKCSKTGYHSVGDEICAQKALIESQQAMLDVQEAKIKELELQQAEFQRQLNAVIRARDKGSTASSPNVRDACSSYR